MSFPTYLIVSNWKDCRGSASYTTTHKGHPPAWLHTRVSLWHSYTLGSASCTTPCEKTWTVNYICSGVERDTVLFWGGEEWGLNVHLPVCCDYTCVLPCSVYVVLGFEPRASCILSRLSDSAHEGVSVGE